MLNNLMTLLGSPPKESSKRTGDASRNYTAPPPTSMKKKTAVLSVGLDLEQAFGQPTETNHDVLVFGGYSNKLAAPPLKRSPPKFVATTPSPPRPNEGPSIDPTLFFRRSRSPDRTSQSQQRQIFAYAGDVISSHGSHQMEPLPKPLRRKSRTIILQSDTAVSPHSMKDEEPSISRGKIVSPQASPQEMEDETRQMMVREALHKMRTRDDNVEVAAKSNSEPLRNTQQSQKNGAVTVSSNLQTTLPKPPSRSPPASTSRSPLAPSAGDSPMLKVSRARRPSDLPPTSRVVFMASESPKIVRRRSSNEASKASTASTRSSSSTSRPRSSTLSEDQMQLDAQRSRQNRRRLSQRDVGEIERKDEADEPVLRFTKRIPMGSSRDPGTSPNTSSVSSPSSSPTRTRKMVLERTGTNGSPVAASPFEVMKKRIAMAQKSGGGTSESPRRAERPTGVLHSNKTVESGDPSSNSREVEEKQQDDEPPHEVKGKRDFQSNVDTAQSKDATRQTRVDSLESRRVSRNEQRALRAYRAASPQESPSVIVSSGVKVESTRRSEVGAAVGAAASSPKSPSKRRMQRPTRVPPMSSIKLGPSLSEVEEEQTKLLNKSTSRRKAPLPLSGHSVVKILPEPIVNVDSTKSQANTHSKNADVDSTDVDTMNSRQVSKASREDEMASSKDHASAKETATLIGDPAAKFSATIGTMMANDTILSPKLGDLTEKAVIDSEKRGPTVAGLKASSGISQEIFPEHAFVPNKSESSASVPVTSSPEKPFVAPAPCSPEKVVSGPPQPTDEKSFSIPDCIPQAKFKVTPNDDHTDSAPKSPSVPAPTPPSILNRSVATPSDQSGMNSDAMFSDSARQTTPMVTKDLRASVSSSQSDVQQREEETVKVIKPVTAPINSASPSRSEISPKPFRAVTPVDPLISAKSPQSAPPRPPPGPPPSSATSAPSVSGKSPSPSPLRATRKSAQSPLTSAALREERSLSPQVYAATLDESSADMRPPQSPPRRVSLTGSGAKTRENQVMEESMWTSPSSSPVVPSDGRKTATVNDKGEESKAKVQSAKPSNEGQIRRNSYGVVVDRTDQSSERDHAPDPQDVKSSVREMPMNQHQGVGVARSDEVEKSLNEDQATEVRHQPVVMPLKTSNSPTRLSSKREDDPVINKNSSLGKSEIDVANISTKNIRAALESLAQLPSPNISASQSDVSPAVAMRRKSLQYQQEQQLRQETSIGTEPKRAESERRLVQRVKELLSDQKPTEALDVCDEWKRLNPRSAEAWFLSGRAHLMRGEAAPSEHHLNNAIRLVEERGVEGDLLRESAVKELSKVKRMTSARDKCLEDLGKRSGATALSHIARAQEVSPCNPQLRVLKAAAILVSAASPSTPTDDTQEPSAGNASNEVQKAIASELDLAFTFALSSLDILSQVGRPCAQYARVMHRSGLTQEADVLLEEVCNRTNKEKEPLTVCVDLLRLFRSMESAKADANEAYNQGRYGESLRLFSRALELDPVNDVFNAIILSNRAASHMALGDFAKAVVDCDSALKLIPSFQRARLRRARALLKMNKFRESITDFELVMRVSPSPSVAAELADARKSMKDHNDSQHGFRNFFSRQSFSEPTGSASDFGIPRAPPLPRPSGAPAGGFARRSSSAQPAHEDLYKLLGVSPHASGADIKKAYHRAALKHHPDKNVGDSEASQRFKKVLEAFHTLSDPSSRRKYDLMYNSISVPMI